ncbi:hypothetical protein [Microvirga antarctica]|uniref:hypothetical protein n=1 Tax=Microvirga antarctica TaxID=2819233 RepID=UPI001B309723|nr:hypothetical protein [Microvirga antarctica]
MSRVVELHRADISGEESICVSIVVADPLRLDIRIVEGGVATANGLTLDAAALHILGDAILEAECRIREADILIRAGEFNEGR